MTITDTAPTSPLAPTVLQRRDLHDGWTVRPVGGPVPDGFDTSPAPASVPGVVHLDLLAAGRIPDPYLDDNEAKLAWIGLVDWTFSSWFDMTDDALAASDRHELVFEGLDTVATVTLNGQALAEVANQHRTYRLDVSDVLVAGTNVLDIAFRSPIRYANAQSVALGVRPRAYPLPYDAIRKSACSFGWDWGIATYTSGIWRPARLESWTTARLDTVSVHAEVDGPVEASTGVVEVAVAVARYDDGSELTVEVEVEGVTATAVLEEGETTALVRVDLPSVARWWPAGHGVQRLYDVRVALTAGDELLDETTRRVGFRTLEWDTAPDAAGRPFQLIVNGRRVFVKGVNWIPDDAFFPRIDRARYERRLRQAVAANVNLIRVWGGGMYEDDAFFDLCDELGLLTWQDFLFACAAYAEEEPLRGEVEAEARDNVARIAHHASLALMVGNNESLWGYQDWGWKRRLDGKTWGAYYYDELLPSVVAELAPWLAYAPGSPFSPAPIDGRELHPNDETHGSTHLWEQWNQKDWTTYRDHTPRFVAEFGWQGPPTWSTLHRSVHDQPLTPESPGMIVHQKAFEGNRKLTDGLLPHYRVPEDLETWHWAMQLNQANAVGAALSWFRANDPHTSGAIVWQLNDCWPVTSWAAIDGDEHEKPLYFALKNAFAPRIVTVQHAAAGLFAAVVNDTGQVWDGELRLERRAYDGTVIAAATVGASAAPWTTLRVAVPAEVARPADAASEILVASLEGVRDVWFFAEPRESALPAPALRVAVAADGDAQAVTVTADVLTRDIALLVDKLDPAATVDAALVTLLPGESFTFRVQGAPGLSVEAVSRAGVLRSGNELV